MNVKIVKLLTGEELLAKILPSSNEIVKMENPVRIVVIPQKPNMQYDPNRAPSIGFAPWAEFSDDREFVIDKSHVVAIMTPIKQFVDQYNTMFSKIVTPQSGLILPST